MNTELATTDDIGGPLPSAAEIVSTASLILKPEAFALIERFAERMAKSNATIPNHLKGNVGDCMAITIQAMQWQMNPYAVAQKTHIINGTLGYEAQLVNAAIQTMAPTKDRLHYEWFGSWEKIVGKFKDVESKDKVDEKTGQKKKYRVPDWNIADEAGLGVKVWATMKGEDEPRELVLLMTQARTRNSTLWTDDPKQQLAYLATKRWSRLYCPDVILGVYTPDELEERPVKNMGAAEVVSKEEKLTDAEWTLFAAAAAKGTKAMEEFFMAWPKAIRERVSQAEKQECWRIAKKADKDRTVDNGTPATDAPKTTAKQDANPETGETTPPPAASPAPAADTADFVADMERVEREGGQP